MALWPHLPVPGAIVSPECGGDVAAVLGKEDGKVVEIPHTLEEVQLGLAHVPVGCRGCIPEALR